MGAERLPCTPVLQHKVGRFYLGCHKYAPNSAVNIEMNIPDTQTVRWQDMLRYNNRVEMMKNHLLPKIVYECYLDHGWKGWVGNIVKVCENLHRPAPTENVLYMDAVNSAVLHYSKEATSKPKLRTYIQIKQPDDPPI